MPWQGNQVVAGKRAVVSVVSAGANRNSRRKVFGRRRIAFLRQSWSSNYCGVYAAGMFLSLLGTPVSRVDARRLFRLKKRNVDYQGASPSEVVRALRDAGAIANARWQYFRRFSLSSIHRSLAETSTWTQFPSILFFGVIHRQRGLRARHFAVITAADRFGLRLLDPLGQYPPRGEHNVSLIARDPNCSELESIGCNYLVDTRVEAAILLWRTNFSTPKKRNSA